MYCEGVEKAEWQRDYFKAMQPLTALASYASTWKPNLPGGPWWIPGTHPLPPLQKKLALVNFKPKAAVEWF